MVHKYKTKIFKSNKINFTEFYTLIELLRQFETLYAKMISLVLYLDTS